MVVTATPHVLADIVIVGAIVEGEDAAKVPEWDRAFKVKQITKMVLRQPRYAGRACNVYQMLDHLKLEVTELEAAIERGDIEAAMLEAADVVNCADKAFYCLAKAADHA